MTHSHSEGELCTESPQGQKVWEEGGMDVIREKKVLEHRSSLACVSSLLLKICCNGFADFTGGAYVN